MEDILCVIPSEIDALEAVKVCAANIYHAACHNYLFDGDKQENLQNLYKSIFFIVRAKYFGENGVYISSIKELKGLINTEDEEMLEISQNRGKFITKDENTLKFYYGKLTDYCGKIITDKIG